MHSALFHHVNVWHQSVVINSGFFSKTSTLVPTSAERTIRSLPRRLLEAADYSQFLFTCSSSRGNIIPVVIFRQPSFA
jgi:hypothetical protein